MYCRVVHVKALSELQMKMLAAYIETTMLPRNLTAGQISAEVFSISQSEVFVVSKFSKKSDADKIMSLITFPGSLFLAAISVLPAVIVALMNIQQGWALFYGGTSLLIMVGVAIDTIQQINAYLLNRHYDGLMKSGKTRRVA